MMGQKQITSWSKLNHKQPPLKFAIDSLLKVKSLPNSPGHASFLGIPPVGCRGFRDILNQLV